MVVLVVLVLVLVVVLAVILVVVLVVVLVVILGGSVLVLVVLFHLKTEKMKWSREWLPRSTQGHLRSLCI